MVVWPCGIQGRFKSRHAIFDPNVLRDGKDTCDFFRWLVEVAVSQARDEPRINEDILKERKKFLSLKLRVAFACTVVSSHLKFDVSNDKVHTKGK
jgi:hypothetical protein